MSVCGGLGQTVLGHLHVHIGEGEGMIAVVLVVLIGAEIQRFLGLWRCRRRLCQNRVTKQTNVQNLFKNEGTLLTEN